MRAPRASSQGTSTRPRPARSESASFHESGSEIRGGSARPHCLAASWAMRSRRSRRFAPSFASGFATQRSIFTGTSAAAPSSVSFWTMKSSLSALGTPW